MKKQTFYIHAIDQSTHSWTPVQGVPVKIDDLDCFAHQNIRPDFMGRLSRWAVSEVKTGAQVGEGKTRTAAIANAILRRASTGSLETTIAGMVKRWGLPPTDGQAHILFDYHHYRAEFERIFRQPLGRFWNDFLGFDIVKFDDTVLHSGDESINDYLLRVYGQEAVDLITALNTTYGI